MLHGTFPPSRESYFCVLRAKGGKAASLTPAELAEACRSVPSALCLAFVSVPVAHDKAFNQFQLLMLFLQEEINKHTLLLFNLFADVLGNVRNHPVNQHAEEHDQVLQNKEQQRIHCFLRWKGP